ncbi:hypothetical protein BDW22DRAFT_1364100 [Trametopsis cervina]|nr:hypothetical protein BDW22DRAFT_1364100 [Trametopsis cervina]
MASDLPLLGAPMMQDSQLDPQDFYSFSDTEIQQASHHFSSQYMSSQLSSQAYAESCSTFMQQSMDDYRMPVEQSQHYAFDTPVAQYPQWQAPQQSVYQDQFNGYNPYLASSQYYDTPIIPPEYTNPTPSSHHTQNHFTDSVHFSTNRQAHNSGHLDLYAGLTYSQSTINNHYP